MIENIERAPKSTEVYLNWPDAILYCFSIGNGWRLPTIDELDQLYIENELETGWYWSSTIEDNSIWYRVVGPEGSFKTAIPMSNSDQGQCLVLPVRTI